MSMYKMIPEKGYNNWPYIVSDDLYINNDTVYVAFFLKAQFCINHADTFPVPSTCPVQWNHVAYDVGIEKFLEVRSLRTEELKNYSLTVVDKLKKLHMRHCD